MKVLLSDTEAFDNCAVTFDIVLDKIVEELSSFADHLLHTAAGMVILRVGFEMLGELVDPRGKNGNLHFGRTGVAFVDCVFFDELLFGLLCDHDVSPFFFTGANSACGR